MFRVCMGMILAIMLCASCKADCRQFFSSRGHFGHSRAAFVVTDVNDTRFVPVSSGHYDAFANEITCVGGHCAQRVIIPESQVFFSNLRPVVFVEKQFLLQPSELLRRGVILNLHGH